MLDTEAVKLATTIAELWPYPVMGDVRRTFYAKALGAAISSFEDGLRAVDALFLTERYAPTPGDVIDRALGIPQMLDREWTEILRLGADAQARRPIEDSSRLPAEGMQVFRQVLPGALHALPLENAVQLDRYRQQYVKRRGDQLRADATGRLSLAEGR